MPMQTYLALCHIRVVEAAVLEAEASLFTINRDAPNSISKAVCV